MPGERKKGDLDADTASNTALLPAPIDAREAFRKLAPRMRKAVGFYLSGAMGDWNRACRLAGYADPGNAAFHLQRNPIVSAYVADRLDSVVMPSTELLGRLTAQARADITDLPDDCWAEVAIPRLDAHGKEVGYAYHRKLNLTKVREYGLGHLIKSVEPTKHGDKVVLHDSQRALEILGKYRKLWSDAPMVGVKIDLRALSDEELEAKLAELDG